jgi:hypothetical protein
MAQLWLWRVSCFPVLLPEFYLLPKQKLPRSKLIKEWLCAVWFRKKPGTALKGLRFDESPRTSITQKDTQPQKGALSIALIPAYPCARMIEPFP